jgi:sodium pump decarboxylase gamma subunit
MIIAGLKLTIMGITVVYFFLILLIIAIKISFKILSARSAGELAEMKVTELNKKKCSPFSATEDKVLVAVISAAVSAHHAKGSRNNNFTLL